MNSKRDLKSKITKALERNRVHVRNFRIDRNSFGYYSGYITSDTFNGKTEAERQTIIWNILKKEIEPEEIVTISGVMPLTSDEYDRVVKSSRE